MPQKSIIIQLSKSLKESTKLLDLNSLINSLETDPDLSEIPFNERPQVLQTLHACTGCDYVSYIGKCTFLSTFFQHAGFITGGQGSQPPGSMGVISLNKGDPSLWSFF